MERVVKVDNKYYEVTIDGEGLKLLPISEEKYLSFAVDNVLLTDMEISGDDNIMQNIVDSAQKTLLGTLENNITATVLKILGFSKDNWGHNGWQIDHCNGRMSDLTNHLTQQVKTRLLNVDLNIDFTLTDQELIEIKQVMKKEFVDTYKYQVKRETQNYACQIAQKHVEEFTKDMVKNKLATMSSVLIDQILKPKKSQ